jgi:hypothetical protein
MTGSLSRMRAIICSGVACGGFEGLGVEEEGGTAVADWDWDGEDDRDSESGGDATEVPVARSVDDLGIQGSGWTVRRLTAARIPRVLYPSHNVIELFLLEQPVLSRSKHCPGPGRYVSLRLTGKGTWRCAP